VLASSLSARKLFGHASGGAVIFNGHAIAFELPVGHLLSLSNPDEFWPVYQKYGTLAESLPNGSDETVRIFVDFLASETRFCIPSSEVTGLGNPVISPQGVTVWSCMTPNDAKLVNLHLKKRILDDASEPTRIFTAYDQKFQHHPELCSVTLLFFARLKEHISNDNNSLIIASVTV